jgi:ferritin-like metal-binding protein YciE
MGMFSTDIKSMSELFQHQLQDTYYAEHRIIAALPKMVEKATASQLKSGLTAHLAETRTHVTRIEQVFANHKWEPKQTTCPAIKGIINEADDVVGDIDNKGVLDAAIIAAAQTVEHYEIARYRTMVTWAKQAGWTQCAVLLQQNLDEEIAADRKLEGLAQSAALPVTA